MPLLGIFMVVYALLITPLQLRVDVAAGAHVSGALVLRIWGLHLQANVGLIRNEQGRLHLAFRLKGSPKQHSGSVADTWKKILVMIRMIRETNITKAFFTHTLSVLHVNLKARIGFSDAAYTALTAGSIGILLNLWRERLKLRGIHCSLNVWPDFEGNPCAAQFSCILFMRMGNLLLGCALASAAARAVRRRAKLTSSEEERAWSTPSET